MDQLTDNLIKNATRYVYKFDVHGSPSVYEHMFISSRFFVKSQ